ncbi:antitoxin VbhA family protein [Hymenobacter terricola]
MKPRRYRVEQVFARVERAGGTVSPFARHLYERYVAGELTLK